MASVAKTFVATLALRAVARGALSLDAPLAPTALAPSATRGATLRALPPRARRGGYRQAHEQGEASAHGDQDRTDAARHGPLQRRGGRRVAAAGGQGTCKRAAGERRVYGNRPKGGRHERGRLRGRDPALSFGPMKPPATPSPQRLTLADLSRARGGVAVQSGVRSGRAKTADKNQKQLLDYLKS